eukprot:5415605-Pyramimonas_sp.AAC.1
MTGQRPEEAVQLLEEVAPLLHRLAAVRGVRAADDDLAAGDAEFQRCHSGRVLFEPDDAAPCR